MTDSLDKCIIMLKALKDGIKMKGLRGNMKKTKLRVSVTGLDVLRDSGAFICAVCRSGVRDNSIHCSQCGLWGHKTCSDVGGRLVANPDYICPRCCGKARPIDGRRVTEVDVDGTLLNDEANFYYLGDMLCAGGGCTLAIAARCCTAWGKFKKLLPILSSKHLSLTTRGEVFDACIRSALLHGSKKWVPSADDLQRLHRNDRAMICWICRTKPHETPTELLCARLGIQEVTEALHSKRLRWYGLVSCSSACINMSNMKILCTGKCGGPRKTWSQCVKEDIR
jgi:hypothetical protein